MHWLHPKRAWIALVLFACAAGCSGGDGGGAAGSARHEKTSTATQFVVWLPATDPLVTEHTQWHQGGCGNPGARQCPFGPNGSGGGQEFLMFHRNFLHRLRAKYISMGLTGDITPWYGLPPEMHNPNNGWTSALASAEANIFGNHDPATGKPFASLEAFGNYIEWNYHNALHGIAARAYNVSDSPIGPVSTSPTSTYFFKIHGLIEYLFDAFQRGDLNNDGQSDIVVAGYSYPVGTDDRRMFLLAFPP